MSGSRLRQRLVLHGAISQANIPVVIAQGWGAVQHLQGVRVTHSDSIAAYEAWLGRSANLLLAFANGTTWSNLIDYAELQADLWGPTHAILWSVGIPPTATLAEVAAGTHDAQFVALADLFLATRPGDATIVIRPVWEAQISSNAWYAYGDEVNYIAAFRRIVQVFLNRSLKFRIDWCVNQTTTISGSPYDPALFYPGDDYVDVIGQDVYYILDYGGGSGDNADPVVAWRLKQTDSYGLNWLTSFATAHGKPVSIPEWGTDSDAAAPLISLMAEWQRDQDVAYSLYYDEDGTWPTKLSGGALPPTGMRFRTEFGGAPPANLWTFGKDFSNAAWSKTNITISEGGPDPAGGMTAEGLVETAATGEHHAWRAISRGALSRRLRVSVKFKPLNARNFARIQLFQASYGDGASAYFDLPNGNAGSYFDYGGIDFGHHYAIPQAAGFVKCGFEVASSGASDVIVQLQAALDGTDSYAGDTAKGVYAWDATLRELPAALTMPVLWVAGASLESRNHCGDASSRFGHSCVGPLTWANMIDGERLFNLRVAKRAGVSPYWQPGTNFAGSGASYGAAGSFGSSIADQAAEIAAAISPGDAIYCSLGRNDLPSVTAAQYLANFDTFITTIRAANPGLIILPGLWKRDTSAGGTWASGGSSRQDVDDINIGLAAYCAAHPDMIFVEMQSVMCDAGGDQNPKAGYLVDTTHLSPLGAYVSGKAHKAALAGYITPTAFPARSGDDLLTDLSGTGGTLTNGATGSVNDGWTLLRGASGDAMGVAGQAFTDGNGKRWQRITCTRAATHSGGSDSFTFRPTNPLSIPSSANLVARARVHVPITTVLQMFHFGLAELTSGSTQRAGAIFGTTNGDDAVIADGAAVLGYPGAEALDLYLETPVLVTASGGTRTGDIRFSNAMNQGAPGTTAVYEITDLQMEPV